MPITPCFIPWPSAALIRWWEPDITARQPEWRQIYRSLEHGYARRQCGDSRIMSQFPIEIRQFAEHFADAQLQRHLADYDPDTRLGRREVLRLIDETEQNHQ